MGTDVHMSVQLRAVTGYTRKDRHVRALERQVRTSPELWPQLEAIEVRDGPWEVVAVDTWSKRKPLGEGWRVRFTPWLDREGKTMDCGDSIAYRLTGPLPDTWWSDRDYACFARLAGVRNGRGFAGVRTGPGCVPISEPRGLPEGWDPPLMERDEDYDEEHESPWWPGDHSYTHLLASEILGYKWEESTKHAGLLKPERYDRLMAEGSKPESFSFHNGELIVSQLEWDQAKEPTRKAMLEHGPLLIRYEYTVARTWAVKQMAQDWADRFGAEDVRLVFGFDS